MERCRDLPLVTVRAVSRLGINCTSQGCRKTQDRRDLRRSVSFNGISVIEAAVLKSPKPLRHEVVLKISGM